MKDRSFLEMNGVNVTKSLDLFGDMEMYNDTVRDFPVSAEEKLNKLQMYKERGDMPNYAIYAHSLKSDARYFGFEQMAEIAYKHELESKANNVNFVYNDYDNFVNEVRKVISIVRQYMGEETESVQVENTIEPTKDKAILVVDDSDMIRTFVEKIFNSEYEVISLHDGNEAIRYINENNNKNIVGMLLDLYMPNCDGFQVLEYFKQKNLFTKIPVSIITGEDKKDPIEKTFAYPIVDVLNKPFNERDVKRIIEKTIKFNQYV